MNSYADAIDHIRARKRMCRKGWNGKGMYVFLIESHEWEFSAMGEHLGASTVSPFIAMKTVGGTIIPWLCSQADALADDWEVYNDA